MDWEQLCKELQQRVVELEKENQELRRQLGYTERIQSVVPESTTIETIRDAAVHMKSTPEEKIRLFRSLFRGREDVFARRWCSVQKEKGGYTPVCTNEWKYGVCIKPKGKCSKCENRLLVPLDDAIIYKHFFSIDIYCHQ